MNSAQLLNCKNEYLILDQKIIDNILNLFKKSTTKSNKVTISKNNNILKNSKFRLNKNKISNKTILILNKVSETNINKLLIEFINNISVENENDFKIVQQEFFIKIVKDSSFIKFYIKFITQIFQIIYYNKKYLPIYFLNLIEKSLKVTYQNGQNTDDFSFLDITSDEYRKNVLNLIYNLNNFNYFNNYMTVVDNILLNQNKYIEDIYFWFNLVPNKEEYKDIIKNKLTSLDLNFRDIILLNNLLENNINKKIEYVNTPISTEKECNITDIFQIQINNTIEEFNYLKSQIEVIEFINLFCIDYNKKHLFIYSLLDFYFSKENNIIDDYLQLFTILIKKKIIFKNLLSKTLFTYISKKKSINEKKLLEFVKFLKKNNITKNIEFLYNKFQNL
uniref:Uncharacterized protein n=1 Tax=viral metagenome TaxID=1070528 RepID=A0A6C0J3T7_9ZZZZ